jgi:hypothetical protein
MAKKSSKKMVKFPKWGKKMSNKTKKPTAVKSKVKGKKFNAAAYAKAKKSHFKM